MRSARRRLAVALLLAWLGSMAALGPAAGSERRTSTAATPTLAGCRVFPADNPWNQRVDQLPVAADSARILARIGLGTPLHPDFGTVYAGAPNGIPITIGSRRTRRLPVRFQYASESDREPYPLPRGVAIEGGPGGTGDRHVIVLDAHPHCGYWTAGSGAIFSLRSDRLRPAGWTSADAAGLPILPGLARYAEVAAGAVDHALRFTAPCTAPRYVYPARHFAATCSGPNRPPMGLRVRLKASADISGLPYQARVVAIALKHYGLILADNGSPWYISGAPDRRWNDAALHTLNTLSGRDFQVVDTRSLPHPTG
jgi:hypothetical protein